MPKFQYVKRAGLQVVAGGIFFGMALSASALTVEALSVTGVVDPNADCSVIYTVIMISWKYMDDKYECKSLSYM